MIYEKFYKRIILRIVQVLVYGGLLRLSCGMSPAQFFQGNSASCSEGQLYIKEGDLRSNLHITGFVFDLERGSFLGIARFPEEWDLRVERIPGGDVKIEGSARSVVGGISAHAFGDIAVYVHGVCDEQEHLAVHGKLTVTGPPGFSHELPFSAYSFELLDSPIRRRLGVH